ncbi:MAG: PilN domain-containing protein [Myxococcota bacterium]|jgi:type IV pilus assembly protein PilN|nr:PilN domain-containing protein [Myxococcota bacterium]
MIRINLRPVRISKRQEAVRKELIVGAIGLLATLVVAVFFYTILGSEVSRVKGENASMTQELDQLSKTVRRVEEVDEMKAELQTKLSVIAELKARKMGPVHMMDELSTATPEKLTLTGLSEKDGRLLLEGFALNHEIIAQFNSNLEMSDWFDEVFLISIEEEEQEGFRFQSFSIQGELVVPGHDDQDDNGENAGGGR